MIGGISDKKIFFKATLRAAAGGYGRAILGYACVALSQDRRQRPRLNGGSNKAAVTALRAPQLCLISGPLIVNRAQALRSTILHKNGLTPFFRCARQSAGNSNQTNWRIWTKKALIH